MVSLASEHFAEDNRRFVVRLDDGAKVEAVLYRGDSLCISSQVGCAVGCPFCASGAFGLDRPLQFEELVGQIELVRERLAAPDIIRRVTISGVGEPLHNHLAATELVRWCQRENLGVSITTSGGPLHRLREWLVEIPHRGLTLSVHAGTEAIRAQMVPRGPSLDDLFDLLSDALPHISNSRRRKIALAYLLIEGFNDHDDEIDAFVKRVEPFPFKLHLYRHNAVPTSPLRGVSIERYYAIAERIKAQGLQLRMSSQARIRKNGGCGTLLAELRIGRGTQASGSAMRSRLPILNA